MPSSRRIDLKVERAPGCFGRVVALVRCVDSGSVTELTWSWSRILMTSRGAMQNLEFTVLVETHCRHSRSERTVTRVLQ